MTDDDRFEIAAAGFARAGAGLSAGALLANQFQSSTSNVAANANVRFFYDTDDARLYFDRDGSAGGFGPVLLARLQPGATVVIGDFAII